MLITEEYRELNSQLHLSEAKYGAWGNRWAEHVRYFVEREGIRSVLDYGCGKASLAEALSNITITCYDPAIPKYSVPPLPHEFVVCTDVLEHVEPECIEDVLKDLERLTLKKIFFVVSLTRAIKSLPDGRNTHVLLRPPSWWVGRLEKHFEREQIIIFPAYLMGVLNSRRAS